MIRSLLFDMGNVLVLFSHERMCSQVSAASGTSLADVRQVLMTEGLQWAMERGEIDETEFTRRFNDRLGCRVSQADLVHACSDIFTENPGMDELLGQLRELELRLVLLSNTSQSHVDHIQRKFSVLSHFDAFATSCSVGAMKPDQRIYQRAIELAGCRADECFYTDDIEDYVIAARELGIHAEVFTEPSTLREHLAARAVLR